MEAKHLQNFLNNPRISQFLNLVKYIEQSFQTIQYLRSILKQCLLYKDRLINVSLNI